MIKTISAFLLATLAVCAFGDEAKVSSQAMGQYRASDKELLAPTFVNAVNHYLRRYEPKLVNKSATQVKMTAVYDFQYAIELQVRDSGYEITVTLDEGIKASKHAKAQSEAAHLVTGVQKTFQTYLRQNAG